MHLGDQAKVSTLLHQVLLLKISAAERDIVKSFLKEKYMFFKQLYYALVSVSREMT